MNIMKKMITLTKHEEKIANKVMTKTYITSFRTHKRRPITTFEANGEKTSI